jgi:hypothetical protein
MARKFKLAGVLAALGLFSLASGAASAGIIDFNFNNKGSIVGAEICGGNCLRVTTTGTATETSGIAGANSWTFSGIMEFSATGWFSAEGDGTGAGLGWKFMDTSGGDNLWGSFSSDVTSVFGLLGKGTVDYLIGGGTGLFNGASGYGGSKIGFALGEFEENGWMHAVTTASVPEPAMVTLTLAGFGMIALVAYRRRRTQSQI